MKRCLFALSILVLTCNLLQAQNKTQQIPLRKKNSTDVNVVSSEQTFKGKDALKVMAGNAPTEAKFVRLADIDFKDGIIELELAGKTQENASDQARGFVGLAFRINNDNSKFECFYLRPTNGRADDQVRRNHSVQYISFPDYPWAKLRKEFPEKYESYADMVPGEWIKVKVEVSGGKAKLFVNGSSQPVLIVNDLKLGAGQAGAIGLWVGPGTEAYFSNLNLTLKTEN